MPRRPIEKSGTSTRRRSSVGVVELANDLGVSTATVSRALNGSAAVRPELADRIRAHAESRGYVINRLAKALASSTSREFVGFVIPYVDTPAYSAVAAECAQLLSAGGTQMILAITHKDPERELQQLREMLGSKIAGLIISPSTHMLEDSRRLLAEFPVVELHRRSGMHAPAVFSDDEDAGGPEALSNGAARLRGVHRGMRLAGLDPDRMPIRLVEPTQQNGYDAASELLAGDHHFTGLLVGGGSLSV